MSYHLIVHLKAKGTATLWPDKVAVLHAWFLKVGHSVVVFLTRDKRSATLQHWP